MTAIPENNRARRRPGVQHMSKHSLKTDMTPMVDLGFLLISFFVFTTEMSKPRTAPLYMPKDGPPTDVPQSSALTILLGENDKVFYYEKQWDPALVRTTSLSYSNGIGKIIRDKQQHLDRYPVNGEKREGLILIIKPGSGARYGQVIDALDEVLINDVKKYVIVKPTADEQAWMNRP